MIAAHFEYIVNRRLSHIQSTLESKGKEYAREDRLSNFKAAGAALDCSPERALLGMLIKHQVSIIDMINDLDQGVKHDQVVWNEKIGDAINYYVLLDALVEERRASPKTFHRKLK